MCKYIHIFLLIYIFIYQFFSYIMIYVYKEEKILECVRANDFKKRHRLNWFFVHSYIHWFSFLRFTMYLLLNCIFYLFVHLLIYLFICLRIYLFFYYLLIYLFIYSFFFVYLFFNLFLLFLLLQKPTTDTELKSLINKVNICVIH